MNHHPNKKIIWILFLFLILSQLCAQEKTPEFRTKLNLLEGRQYNSENFPDVTITYRNFYNGSPVTETDEFFRNKVSVWEENHSCLITGHEQVTEGSDITINFLLDLHNITELDLNKLQRILFELKEKLTIHLYQFSSDSLSELKFSELYHQLSLDKTKSHFAQNFAQFIKAKLERPVEREQLYVLFTNFKALQDKDILKSTLSSFSEQVGYWYAIFYLECDKDYFAIHDNIHPNRCLFISNFNNEESVLIKYLETNIELFRQNYYKIKFQAADKKPVKPTRTYNLVSPVKEDTIQTQISITFDQENMQNYFVNTNVQNAKVKSDSNSYIIALDTLSWAKAIFPNDRFNVCADSVIYSWSNYTLNQNDAKQVPLIFERAENHWQISTTTNSIYTQLKIKLLILYFKYLERSNSSIDSRIDICEKIIELDPNNNDFKFTLLSLKGKREFDKRNYWMSANYLSDALAIKKFDNDTNNRLIESVSGAFQHEFNVQNYSYLYKAGKKYLSFIKSIKDAQIQFICRYQYAYATYKMKRYTEAKNDYEWLLTHWNNTQSLVQYNDTFEILQELYIRSMEFEKAFSIFKENFRMNTEQEKMLPLMVTNLRTKYLVPIMNVFPNIWNQINSLQVRQQMFKEFNIIQRPEFVTGLYFVDKSGNIILVAGSKDKVQSPNFASLEKLSDFPAPWNDKNNNRNWLINKLSDGYLILEISNHISQAETIYIQNIQRKKMEDRPWHDFSILEQDMSLPYLSRLLTAIIGRDYAMDDRVQLSQYINELPNSDIQYLVIHNVNGEVIFSEKFEIDQCQFEAKDWQKSSRTMALYRQNLKYANANIIDIANPIFVDSKFRGVVRIGFKKQ